MVYFPPALLFSATLPCAENRHLVSLEQNVGVVAQVPALWQTHPVPRPGGGSVSRGLTVKLRTSCLLCHLCADISEYLTMLLPPPLLCHTPTPTGLEILPGFHLFSTPILLIGGTAQGFSACCSPCLAAAIRSGISWQTAWEASGKTRSNADEQSMESFSTLMGSVAIAEGRTGRIPALCRAPAAPLGAGCANRTAGTRTALPLGTQTALP